MDSVLQSFLLILVRTLITSITGMVTDNLPLILPLVAFGIGFAIVRLFADSFIGCPLPSLKLFHYISQLSF
jgi:hypothetical protein